MLIRGRSQKDANADFNTELLEVNEIISVKDSKNPNFWIEIYLEDEEIKRIATSRGIIPIVEA